MLNMMFCVSWDLYMLDLGISLQDSLCLSNMGFVYNVMPCTEADR